MIGKIAYPVALHQELTKPAVLGSATWADYGRALHGVATGAKERVALNVWVRWLSATNRAESASVEFDERTLESFSSDLARGVLRRENGKPYKRGIIKQAPSCIRVLHHRLCDQGNPLVVRRLLPQRVAGRMMAFAQLTEKTRTALSWFEQHGVTQGKGPRKSPKHLQTATRKSGVYDAVQFLKLLGKTGLEDVRKEDVPDLVLEAADFKRNVRMRHSVETVYRACMGRGLLEHNPLEGVSTATFNKEALRDFLPPDELARIRDLNSLDRSNERCTIERLVILLYVDLALRKNELAGVRVEDVRLLGPGKYQIHLPGKAQKMGDKSTVAMDVLYPETAQLLSAHLRVRGREPGTLILTPRGKQATGEYLYNCVRREARRLKLRTYHGRSPSCHALRRTFASCNSGSLGLRLDPHEMAERMRCGIDVCYEHYVQANPLLRSMRADQHRRLLVSDPFNDARTHLEGLRTLGITAGALEQVEQEVQQRFAPRPAPGMAAWMEEEEVLARLSARWDLQQSHRTLRPYFRQIGAIDHHGPRGSVRYRQDVVDELLQHEPLDNLAGGAVTRRRRQTIAQQFFTLRLGQTVLVRSVDAARVVRVLRTEPNADETGTKSRTVNVTGKPAAPSGSRSAPYTLRQPARTHSVRVTSKIDENSAEHNSQTASLQHVAT